MAVGTDTALGMGVAPSLAYQQELRCLLDAGIDAAVLARRCMTSSGVAAELGVRRDMPGAYAILAGNSLHDCLYDLRVQKVVDRQSSAQIAFKSE